MAVIPASLQRWFDFTF